MCGKVFGGGGSSSKVVEAPTPAVSVAAPGVAAPNQNVETNISSEKETASIKAKGKKKLTIAKSGGSTGVNL